MKDWLKDNPILAGCLGLLVLGTLLSCGAGLLVYLGFNAAVDKVSESTGLDSLMGTVMDFNTHGYGFSMNVTPEEGTVFNIEPLEVREVTCEDIEVLLLPHLTGALETVTVNSSSHQPLGDGRVTVTPLSCTWSGNPGSPTSPPAPLGPPPQEAPASTP